MEDDFIGVLKTLSLDDNVVVATLYKNEKYLLIKSNRYSI